MHLQIGIGFSQNENTIHAAKEAAEQAKAQAGSDRLDMALLLTTPQHEPQKVLSIVEASLDNSRVIGGTTAGIILQNSLHRYGVAVIGFRSDLVKLQTIHSQHLNLKNLTKAGESFVKDTAPTFGQKDRKFLLFFFDGLLENMSDFNAGIQKEIGEHFPLIGVGNSDGLFFSKTTQYHDTGPTPNSACGAFLGGDISIHTACRHGWKPLGKPRLVKKAKKNIIETIGNAPALQFYEEFFQNTLGSLKNDVYGKLNARYPLGVFSKNNYEYIIRNVFDILEDGSLLCQDVVNEGSEIHLMIGNKNSCFQSAASAAKDLKNSIGEKPIHTLFIFESATRWQILKHSWPQELKSVTDVLGDNFPIVGMLTYGELFNPGTLQFPGRNFLLNGNIILMAIV